MAYNIGLNVVEVDGAGAPSIVGAAVSVGAFNILTQRGAPNRPTRINSYTKFAEQFGSFYAGGLGAYLVKGFFDNGGQTAYINRVAATGAEPAAITLDDENADDTLRLEAGYRGVADPGAWGSDLYVRVDPRTTGATRIRETAPATIAGDALGATVDMTNAPALSVRVDGEATPTALTFQPGQFNNVAQATLQEIANAINGQTNKLIASVDDDHLVLTSTGSIAALNRDWTSLQVTANNAVLGFDANANPVRGTPADRTTTVARLANVDALLPGQAIRISDPNRSATARLQRVVPATGEIEWAPAIGDIAQYDPFTTTIGAVEFDLTVASGGTEDENVVETWTGLSMEPDQPNYAVKKLNDSLAGSRYLTASDELSASPSGEDVPATIAFTRLNPGVDGTATANNFIGDPVAHTGFYAFDPYDVQLVTSERSDPAIVTAALAYCANRGDCMYISSVPEGYVGAGLAVGYGQAFQGKKVYGALYGPYIKVFDPLNVGPEPVKWVPPSGHVMGVYARVETTRGIWKAPAGDEANLLGALDVEYRLSDAEHTDLVKNGSVNGIRVVPRAGIVVDASRTLSTDTRWLYVNVRLLFNYVKGSLKSGLRWVRQEPNRDSLWNAVKFGSVTPFLLGLWRQGAFGTGSPTETFTLSSTVGSEAWNSRDLKSRPH